MKTPAELKESLETIEKTLSLRQISLRSGINYITLRNIKFGKSKKVTDRIYEHLQAFIDDFKPEEVTGTKRGRKPKAPVAAVAPATEPVIAAIAETPAPKAEAKTRKPRAAATTGKAKAPRRKKAQPKTTIKPADVPPTHEPAASEPLSFITGNDLREELRRTEARLIYLRSLEKAEKEYLSALGKK